jgi:hypothetical protein
VYIVYNAFTTPFQPTTATPRALVGVVKHADTAGSAPTGAFTELHRGAPGDPRGSSANALISEFLGDYVYATATRTYGAAAWNDTRNAQDCPAIDAWRQTLQYGQSPPPPAPEQDCGPANTFGNSDIFGGSSPRRSRRSSAGPRGSASPCCAAASRRGSRAPAPALARRAKRQGRSA